MDLRLSLIIPAYNEEKRLDKTLRAAETYLSSQECDSEIIVVDDGSRDRTAGLVRESFPEVRLVSYQPNRGKGHAVKTGMLAAQGDYRVFYDADGSTPIEEIDKVWPRFEAGADVVIGSRSLPESDVAVRQHPFRELMGRGFNALVRMLLRERFADTQCGFKAFSRKAAEAVFARQLLDGFCFDSELLYIAARLGFRIDEIPVRWLNSPDSRVRIVSDSARMFTDLVRIRLNDLRGKYT